MAKARGALLVLENQPSESPTTCIIQGPRKTIKGGRIVTFPDLDIVFNPSQPSYITWDPKKERRNKSKDLRG